MIRDDVWFEDLFRRHRPAVAAYCARRVGTADAADAVAQTFTTAWRRRHDVPDDDDDAIRWLYGVARNVVSHQFRSSTRSRRLVERVGAQPRPTPPDPETTAVRNDDQQRVRDAVMALRPNDREVLLLAAWEGLTHAEIADVIDCSVAAVDKRVTRAKRRLAARYERLHTAGSDRADAPAADDTRPAARPGLTGPPVRAPRGGGAR